MTFTEFNKSADAVSLEIAADILLVDVEYFNDADDVTIFDGSCFMTRKGENFWTIVGRDDWLSTDPIKIASHVYFDHYVWECELTEAFMIQFYDEWLDWQGLPKSCALELQMGADLTSYQRQWLSDFSGVWDDVVG